MSISEDQASDPYDGSVLVGGQGAIRTVKPQTGGVSHEDTSTNSSISDLAITSDGEYAVTTALDQTVRVLDLRQGQLVGCAPFRGANVFAN